MTNKDEGSFRAAFDTLLGYKLPTACIEDQNEYMYRYALGRGERGKVCAPMQVRSEEKIKKHILFH